MENPIPISKLNDFIFCPISIFFHNLYDGVDDIILKESVQINGTNAHKCIDDARYSTSKDILQGIDVYCERYNLYGRIDTFNIKSKCLTERKKRVTKIYDGYVFQLYAQYFSLIEMGYVVENIFIHSLDDNINYNITLPSDNIEMFNKFEILIDKINRFDFNGFVQDNCEKCNHCIYEIYCDRSIRNDFNKGF